MSNRKPREHRTSDLYYAAFLKTAGVKLLGTEKGERGRVTYLFEWLPTIEELKMGYFNRSSKVSALTFVDEIKAMKALTYAD